MSQRYRALLRSLPKVKSDFDVNGNVTGEAVQRAADWIWEQLSEAERKEFEEQARTNAANEIYKRLIAEGEIEEFISADGQECIRFLA